MKLIVPFICFLFASFNVSSQLIQTVRGRVIDTYSEGAIPFAKLYLMNNSDTLRSQSDIEGYFRFTNVKIGRYNLLTVYNGYAPNLKSNIEITATKEVVLEITLLEDLQEVEGVEVVGKDKNEANNELATVSVRNFSVEEAQRYAGTLNDVARMAQNFAGVQGADDSRNDIIIRGNSPTGVLYRMEGMDIPNPNHFARFGTTGGPISMLNNNVLANSDFFTGAFPAEYGNALAGVFDLKLRHGNNERHEFMAQIGFNGLEAMAEGPISKENKSSYLVNFRYSTLEVFDLIGVSFGTAAQPRYQDGSFKLRFPSKKGVTQVFGLGGLSNINLLAKDLSEEGSIFGFPGNDVYFTSNTGMIGVSHKERINDHSFFELMTGLQSAYNAVDNDTLNEAFENVFRTYTSNVVNTKQSTVFNYQNKISNQHLIKVGVINDIYFLDLQDTLWSSELQEYRPLQSFDGTAFLTRAHIQHRYRVTENLTLVSGLYGQFLNLANQFSVEPRVGINQKLKNGQSINLGYGLHSQMAPLEVYFRQVRTEEGIDYSPNRNLDFTRSHHLIIGYSKSFKKGYNIKSEVYGQYLFNVPIEVSSKYSLLNFGSSFITATPDTLVNEGNGFNYGVELTIEKYLKNGIYFLFSGSLFESKYKAADNKWYNTAFNTNHTLNLLGGYEWRLKPKANAKSNSAITFDASFVWNGGARYTPILLQQSIAAQMEIRDFENNNFNASYADYLKGNFKIGFKLYGKKATQEWSVDIQNFTNRRNVFIQEYNQTSQDINTTFQTGFLPIVQYRVTF